MSVATVGLSGLLAALSGASGIYLARRPADLVGVLDGLGVPRSWIPWLSAAKMTGAVGVLAGLWWPPLGIAAAVGLFVYFLGAVLSHLRVGDWNLGGALALTALATAVCVLQLT